jgi:stress response protein YsnF
VSHGRVRIRSYVVETPVSEQVDLREEHVEVQRRPVDRTISGTEDAFRERTIEMEERGEEAVVSKEARVKEELVVRKGVEQRTETISDTIRRTEVEVDDERANAVSTTRTRDRR